MASNFIFISEVLDQLKAQHFEVSQKSFEKIIRKEKIKSFPIDGRLCIDFDEYTAKSDSIKNALANAYATSKANISKGQLKSKAIQRGIFKFVRSGTLLEKDILAMIVFIRTEFTNKTTALGDPPASKEELYKYLDNLLKAQEKLKQVTETPIVEDKTDDFSTLSEEQLDAMLLKLGKLLNARQPKEEDEIENESPDKKKPN